MDLKMTLMLLKVALLAFLIMGFTSNFADAHRFDARSDASSFLTRVLSRSSSKSSSSACCDSCVCTRSIPPQCQCFDIGEDCHSACEKCVCALSYPPKCRCYDITDFCYESCSSYAKRDH